MVWLLGIKCSYRQLLRGLSCSGSLTGLGRHSRVLDAGIGGGDLSLALADQLVMLPELHGVDLSPRMLALARRRLASLGQQNLSARLRLATIGNLPYPSQTFDLVMCAHVLEHCESLQVPVNELMRVLKPGGVLILVTSRAHPLNLVQGVRWGFRPIKPERMQEVLVQAGAAHVTWPSLGSSWLPARWISRAAVAVRGEGQRVDDRTSS